MASPKEIGRFPQESGNGDATSTFRLFAARLEAGDGDAAFELLSRYSARLISLARQRIGQRLASKVEPDDVIQSAMRTFFRRLRDSEIELRDWSSLSGLLTLLTLRKCVAQGRTFSTSRRDVKREVSVSTETGDISIPGREPNPQEVAEFVDLVDRLIEQSPERDRLVVEGLLAGETVSELASRLGRTERTIYRTIDRLRGKLASSSFYLSPTRPSL